MRKAHLILAMAAAMGGLPVSKEPDRRQREESRMKLNDEELAHLETLSGKEKKQYVKFLREKYR